MRPGGGDDANDVVTDSVLHVDELDRFLQRAQITLVDDLPYGLDRVLIPLRFQDGYLVLVVRVAELQAYEEAVELRFGQREGALVLDRVLGRHHDERFRHAIGHAVHGDLVLLHALEQCGLSFGGCAVDLIGEHDLGHDWPRAVLELLGLLVVDRHAGDVRRQQVGCELNPAERAAEGLRQTAGKHRLAHAGHILDEQVSSAHQRHHGEPLTIGLADNHLLHTGEDTLRDVPRLGS